MDFSTESTIVAAAHAAHEARAHARSLLKRATCAVEIAIGQNETAALESLEQTNWAEQGEGKPVMTQDELRQWNESACVWRCLIKLANTNGNPINKDEFTERFQQLFRDREISEGSFDPESLSKVCRLLGLPEHSQVCNDYSVVERDFNTNNRHILIMSEIDLTPGSVDVGKHCSVLTKIDSRSFSIWTPYQSGGDGPLDLDRSAWITKRCFGVALF